jgi:hypothetical protein
MAKKGARKKKVGLVDVIARAVLDEDIKTEMLKNSDRVAKRFSLSELDTLALRSIGKAQLDEASKRLQMHADWWIGIGFYGTFSTPPKKK